MNEEQFEKCKEFTQYDEFMSKGLEFDGLTMNDYMEFMPKVLPILLERKEKDPFIMFEELIEELRNIWTASEELPFHGPWHHGIVPAILIKSLVTNEFDFNDSEVKEAFTRGLKIPAGGCGFCGTCGAGTGAGIAISIANKSTPFHNKERSFAFKTTLKATEKIGKLGGPRCCRLSTYVALEKGVEMLKELGYEIPLSKAVGRCKVSDRNGQCHEIYCPYYAKNKK